MSMIKSKNKKQQKKENFHARKVTQKIFKNFSPLSPEKN